MILDKTTKRLLSKEAALSSMNLGVGLTFLRKYNFAEIGFIYQSFFSLSVGLERLMKLILIYEHIVVHNSFPNEKDIKGFGHDLVKLYLQVKGLSTKYSSDRHFEGVDRQDICKSILENLSDFAEQNRYSHINKLIGNNKTDDPLLRWEKEVNSVIIKQYYRQTKKDDAMISMATVMEGSSVIRHTSENDDDIINYSEFMKHSLQVETKQKYGMYFTYCIINALCEFQINQNYQSRTNISLDEFYKTFRVHHKYAIKRKSWNPYSPYKF